MSELLNYLGILFGAINLIVLIGAIAHYRRVNAQTSSLYPEILPVEQPRMISAVQAEAREIALVLPSVPLIPETLSFNEAINDDQLAEKTSASIIESIKNSFGGDFIVAGVQLIDLNKNSATFLAKFPQHAEALKKSSQAVEVISKSGEAITVLKDVETGKFISMARKVDPSLLDKAALLGPLVLNAAHLITNWDNARKLKSIVDKVDLLTRGLHNERLAELEATFEMMKELDARDTFSKTDVAQIKMKLKALRSQWMRQALDELDAISDPGHRNAILKKTGLGSQSFANQIKEQTRKSSDPIALARMAYSLEVTIAMAQGDFEAHQRKIVSGVKNQIVLISQKVQEKTKWVMELSPETNLKDLHEVKRICDEFILILGGTKEAPLETKPLAASGSATNPRKSSAA